MTNQPLDLPTEPAITEGEMKALAKAQFYQRMSDKYRGKIYELQGEFIILKKQLERITANIHVEKRCGLKGFTVKISKGK